MKKIVLVLFVTLMGVMAMNAQPQRGSGMVKQRVEQLTKALGLDDEQKAQITQILKEGMSHMQEGRPTMKEGRPTMKEGETPNQTNKESRRERFQKERAAIDAKIAKVLTPEQRQVFEQLRQDEQKRDPSQNYGPHNRHRGDHHKKAPKDGNCCKAGDNKGGCDKPKCDEKSNRGEGE